MTTHARSSSSSLLWKRIIKVWQGEGLAGVFARLEARRKCYFQFFGGYLIACPIEAQAEVTGTPDGLQVMLVSPDDPGVPREVARIYDPPYTEDEVLQRWKRQNLLCFLGRVHDEAVGCVWVQHSGDVVIFNKSLFTLAADEAYYKDSWVKQEWRGRNIYPAIKAASGKILRERYGTKTAVSIIQPANKPSLHASRKLGGRRVGWITYLKLFRRRYSWKTVWRTRAQ